MIKDDFTPLFLSVLFRVVSPGKRKPHQLIGRNCRSASSAQGPVQNHQLRTDSVRLSGSRFEGISGADGSGVQDSSSNYPIVQLRDIDPSQVTYLLGDPHRGWSDTSFSSLPVSGFVPAPALATVFTNGIPSDSKYLVVPP